MSTSNREQYDAERVRVIMRGNDLDEVEARKCLEREYPKASDDIAAETKSEIADVEQQLDGAGAVTEENGRLALSVYDFSQNLVKIWEGSDSAQRRTILECASLNRVLTDASLCVTKRRPFDWLAERPFLQNGSGGWI